MTMARRLVLGAVLVAGILVTGCQNPDKLQLQAQADEITKLQTENADLRSKLAQAMSERDAARSRLAALEQRLGASSDAPLGSGAAAGWPLAAGLSLAGLGLGLGIGLGARLARSR